jgi:hypothetical protein
MNIHKAGALALAIGSLALPSCGRKVTERDAAYKTNSGTLVEADLRPGYYPSAMLPHIDIIKLPKFLQTVTVQATEGSPFNKREELIMHSQGILIACLEREGTTVETVYGDWNSSLATSESSELIFVAFKSLRS